MNTWKRLLRKMKAPQFLAGLLMILSLLTGCSASTPNQNPSLLTGAAPGEAGSKPAPVCEGGSVVKVLLERTIKGGQGQEFTQLLQKMRTLAMQQPGYISGETLRAADDPNHYLVISVWKSMAHWQAWLGQPERQKIQDKIDTYSPTTIRVYTY